MKKHFFSEKYNNPIVIALGFFDCIHNGHKALIDEMQRNAKKLNCESALMTFANDPNIRLKKRPQIYTIVERSLVLENLGIDNLIYSYFNEEFSSMEAESFLNLLTTNFNIKAIVVGRDYKFGANAEGSVEYLKSYCDKKDIKVKIVPFEKNYDKKVSTTGLKKLVLDGNISMLNTCLTEPYFLVGTIIHAKQRGSVIGFPTANISVHDDALRLAEGIFATKMIIDGKIYYGMTNVGSKPTFGESFYSIETYLFDFNRDIYGKEVKLEFHKKMRSIIKFNSIPALIKQLKQDEKDVRAFFGIQSK